MKLYKRIAELLYSIENCKKTNNQEWLEKHQAKLDYITAEYLPSGSGFDNGTVLDLTASTSNKLIFNTEYHHMRNGFYVKWTSHQIKLLPSFITNFDLKVTGTDYNRIEDYIADRFYEALNEDIVD